jgi:hypothetical protein
MAGFTGALRAGGYAGFDGLHDGGRYWFGPAFKADRNERLFKRSSKPLEVEIAVTHTACSGRRLLSRPGIRPTDALPCPAPYVVVAVTTSYRKHQHFGRLVHPSFEGICAPPYDRKQDSPQRHRGTEAQRHRGTEAQRHRVERASRQLDILLCVSVSLSLCVSVVSLCFYHSSKARISMDKWYIILTVIKFARWHGSLFGAPPAAVSRGPPGVPYQPVKASEGSTLSPIGIPLIHGNPCFR